MVKWLKGHPAKWLSKLAWCVYDYPLEPFLLAFGIFVIFPHWQNVANSPANYTFQEIWRSLSEDIMSSPWTWGAFILAAIAWMILKYKRRKAESETKRIENARSKEMLSILKAISASLGNKETKGHDAERPD